MPDFAAAPISGKYGYIVAENVDETLSEFLLLDTGTIAYKTMVNTEMMALASSNGWGSDTILGSKIPGETVVAVPEDEPSSVEAPSRFQLEQAYDLWLSRGVLDVTGDAPFDKIEGAVYTGIAKGNDAVTGAARIIQIKFEGGRYIPCQEASLDLIEFLENLDPPRYP